MDIEEELDFCEKRIKEQDEYLDDLVNRLTTKSIDQERYKELKFSAFTVRQRFVKRFNELLLDRKYKNYTFEEF